FFFVFLSFVFFFSSRRRHTRSKRDWSSDVCSSDLYNVFTMDQFRPYSDRLIPAAIIPMYSPEEAIEELEFASRQLGYRVVMMGSLIRRPIRALVEEHPEAAQFVEWYDPIAIDSEHDYDPVWAKCRE